MNLTLTHPDSSIPAADAVQSAGQTNEPACGRNGAEIECRNLMAEFSILHRGRYYYFDRYRYERLADAVAYAQLMRTRQYQPVDTPPFARFDTVESPDVSDRQLMATLAISFENGVYLFEGFRYDHLIDAVNYARQHRLSPTS
jgi:hypothetical protein